ncbi:hypothetical protein B0H12DRAFT_1230476 [Mycena haematopus]|nr:hypothetical protein B0H12DRAFT_1230476 [Mycena haematopus]
MMMMMMAIIFHPPPPSPALVVERIRLPASRESHCFFASRSPLLARPPFAPFAAAPIARRPAQHLHGEHACQCCQLDIDARYIWRSVTPSTLDMGPTPSTTGGGTRTNTLAAGALRKKNLPVGGQGEGQVGFGGRGVGRVFGDEDPELSGQLGKDVLGLRRP